MSKIIVQPDDALLVVDAQLTFMPGGGLAVARGNEIVQAVLRAMMFFPREKRIATKDWHPFGHIGFAGSYTRVNPMDRLTLDSTRDFTSADLKPYAGFTLDDLREYLSLAGAQTAWPYHGLASTPEANLHPSLRKEHFGLVFLKGTDPKRDSYSGFFDNANSPTGLAEEIRKRGVRRIFVCGLAFDYCAGWSAIDAVREGFEAFMIMDATKSVGFPDDSVQKMTAFMQEHGIQMIESTDLAAS